jgi:hypothetical protein
MAFWRNLSPIFRILFLSTTLPRLSHVDDIRALRYRIVYWRSRCYRCTRYLNGSLIPGLRNNEKACLIPVSHGRDHHSRQIDCQSTKTNKNITKRAPGRRDACLSEVLFCLRDKNKRPSGLGLRYGDICLQLFTSTTSINST